MTKPLIDLKRLAGRLNKVDFGVKVTVEVSDRAVFQHPKAGLTYSRTQRCVSLKPSELQAEIENEIRGDLARLSKLGKLDEYFFTLVNVFVNPGLVNPETQKTYDQPMITYAKRFTWTEPPKE